MMFLQWRRLEPTLEVRGHGTVCFSFYLYYSVGHAASELFPFKPLQPYTLLLPYFTLLLPYFTLYPTFTLLLPYTLLLPF
jgi:hypothetical protein